MSDSYIKRMPDAADSYIKRMPDLDIDPAKVYLLVNNSIALSTTIADYYVQQRGLNPAYRRTVSLGTGSTVSMTEQDFYDLVIVWIANFMDQNPVEAVLCSYGVPWFMDCLDDPTSPPTAPMKVGTSSYVGAARFVRDTEGGPVRGVERDFGPPGGPADLRDVVEPRSSTEVDSSFWMQPTTENYSGSESQLWRNALLDGVEEAISVVPFGRVGLPKYNTLIPDETEVETKRMIDDAVAKDGIGAAGGEIHFGLHDRALPWVTGYQGELARQAAKAAAIPQKHYVRSYSVNWPAQTDPEDYTYADMNAGILSEQAFGMIGAAIANAGVDATYANSFKPWPVGAWGFEATSAGFEVGATVIMNGGCAGLGTIAEPFADGINDELALTNGIISGRPLCGAMLYGKVSYPWFMDCFGDPLYAPYKKPKTAYFLDNNNATPDLNTCSACWTANGAAVITPNQAMSPGLVQDAYFVQTGPVISADSVISDALTGFASSALIPMELWIKPITTGVGTIQFLGIQTGEWAIDISKLASGWNHLTPEHIAVTEITPFQASIVGEMTAVGFQSVGLMQFHMWGLLARIQ